MPGIVLVVGWHAHTYTHEKNFGAHRKAMSKLNYTFPKDTKKDLSPMGKKGHMGSVSLIHYLHKMIEDLSTTHSLPW